MKKNILSVIALAVAVGALVFAFVTIRQLSDRIETLEKYTGSLAAQVQQLSSRNESFFSTSDNAVSGSLMVDSWSYAPGNLTVTGGCVQILLPQVAASTPDSCLLLMLNGEIHQSLALALTPDETGAAFDAELRDISFDLPELTGDDVLELWMDVNIGGESHRLPGVEWYQENGELLLVAG